MNWTLVIFLFVGGSSSSTGPNLMTLTNVPGFRTEEMCMEAGQKIGETLMVDGRRNQYRFYCLRQQ